MALFRTYPVPPNAATARRAAQKAPGFPVGLALDPYTGDLIRDGSGRVVVLDGTACAKQYVWKTLVTQRGAHEIYPPDYGTDLAAIRAVADPQAKRATFEREARLLERDPRIARVSVAWQGGEDDAAYATLTVYLANGTQFEHEVRVDGA